MDMTLCYAKNCKDKDNCYRYLAEGDKQYQSMFDPSDTDEKDKDTCEYYIKGTIVEDKDGNKTVVCR